MSGLINPVNVVSTLLSHQTGLSGTPAAANAAVNIGTGITSPRAGFARIRIYGHVSAGTGLVDFALTSSGITTYFNANTSTTVTNTLFSNAQGSGSGGTSFSNTSQAFLYPVILGTSGNYVFNMEMPLEQGDVLQFRVSNGTAGDTTYIDDIEVLLI